MSAGNMERVVRAIWRAPADLVPEERMQAYVDEPRMLEADADGITVRLAYWHEDDKGTMRRETYRDATEHLRIGRLMAAGSKGAIVEAIHAALKRLTAKVRP